MISILKSFQQNHFSELPKKEVKFFLSSTGQLVRRTSRKRYLLLICNFSRTTNVLQVSSSKNKTKFSMENKINWGILYKSSPIGSKFEPIGHPNIAILQLLLEGNNKK